MTALRPHPDPARAAMAGGPTEADGREAPPEHDARRLTGGGREALVWLDGVPYRLRVTRRGKLILTK